VISKYRAVHTAVETVFSKYTHAFFYDFSLSHKPVQNRRHDGRSSMRIVPYSVGRPYKILMERKLIKIDRLTGACAIASDIVNS